MTLDRNSKIFTPIQIGRLRCKNRIEVAPAGCFLTSPYSRNSLQFMEYTKSLAESGAAIVTMGVSSVDERGPMAPGRILNVGDDSYVHDLSEIAELIHTKGALASIELVCSRYMMAPADEVVNGTSVEDIENIFRLFAEGAERCRRAGFDMIMIHGGHGNVPAMFFSRMHNHRTDRYGGSFEGRSRFALDLLDAVRARVGDRLAIEYRISAEELLPGGSELEETLAFARCIEDRIDLIHVSRGLLEVDELLPHMFPPTYYPRAINLDAARRFKAELHVPVNVVGAFDLEHAEQAIAAGEVDMVAMVRTILADTNCVENARRGRADETRPCVRCNSCIHSTHTCFKPIRCAVNPLIGRETEYLDRAPRLHGKKVVIVGGGPGGLEAARTASARGHRVVLFEKEETLGGTLRIASAAPFKQDMKKYLDWSIRMADRDPNIELRTGCEATAERILAEKPDALLVAIGAEPILPRFPSAPAGKTVWAGDVELGAPVGARVVIAGAGFTGLECALSLAQAGHEVLVIDQLPEEQIGADGIHINTLCLRQLLAQLGVRFLCSVRLEDVTEEGALVSGAEGRQTLPCDTVVLSLGVRANAEKVEQLCALVPESYTIGDCGTLGGTLWKTIRGAFDAAMRL